MRKLDHLDRDCLIVFQTEGGLTCVKKQYVAWLRAGGFKRANIDEVGRGLNLKGKNIDGGPSRCQEDNEEVEAAERFAMQVMQVDQQQENQQRGLSGNLLLQGEGFKKRKSGRNRECATGNEIWRGADETMDWRSEFQSDANNRGQ